MSDETVFVDGLRVYKPSEKAPDFIILNGTIDMKELRDWALNHHEDGKVKFVVKESKGGKYYAALDTFQPRQQEQGMAQARQAAEPSQQGAAPTNSDWEEDIPFAPYGKGEFV